MADNILTGCLVISAYAPCPDITATVTPDLKCPNECGMFVPFIMIMLDIWTILSLSSSQSSREQYWCFNLNIECRNMQCKHIKYLLIRAAVSSSRVIFCNV